MPRLLVLLVLLATSPMAHAADLAALAYAPHPGATLPLDAPMRDETGRAVTLRALAGGPPLLLVLGYYRCPNLCGLVRDDAVAAVASAGLQAGRDYRLAMLSIDAAETPADASAAKRRDADRPDAAGWSFLTAPAASIDAVAGATGFRYRPDAVSGQFAHPAGLVVATPGGVISGYLLGLGFTADAMRAALARAARGEVAAPPSPVLLLCFHYDPATGRYTLAVTRVLQAAGGLTAAGIAAALWVAHRRDRNRAA